MTNSGTKLARVLIGTVAAGAMAISAAAPAQARDGGIGVGEVIAGALIIGGIAAVAASASSKNNDSAYARAGYRDGYNGRYGNSRWNDNPRQAVSQCVAAAERAAGGRSWGGRANVTDIRSVKDTRNGYKIKGRIAVNTMGRNWRASDGNYGRGWNGDYRGWNSNLRGYDSGSFECNIERGRIAKLKFSGIRGL